MTWRWQMALGSPESAEWIDAPVPGTAAQALQAAGRWSIESPTPLHDKDIWYRARFSGSGRRTLRFDGLATIAEVFLNGRSILASDNMFLAHEVEVDLAGDNELAIVFRALDAELAKRKGRARWRTRLVENNALRYVRTTLLGHMTGWQPAVHAVGPWRAIELVERPTPRLRASLVGEGGSIAIARGPAGATAETEGASVVLDGAGNGTLGLPKVERWWPHTHGTPRLYEVRMDGAIVGRVGFRTIEVDRGADGRGFGLIVNGLPIFARGACWSASDLVSLAGDRATLAPWIMLAREAHMNMLRVGGTMVYESEDFFALCDELGILVWHDFMFASMDYPIADPAFRASVEAEARQFVERAAAHPSLAVLCGGSEVAQQAAMLGLPPALWTSPLYEEILPAIVGDAAIYVPHSPGGGALPFSTGEGIAHYYGVGAYLRPLEDARRADVRFASECLAFANLPRDPAQRHRNVPRDRGADWDFADVRQHYAELLGVAPEAAPGAVMEAAVAEWRRPGSSCRGALVWMLKDFVPGAGWGVIDAQGAPKLAWEALRRAFRPVQVALTDEGLNGLGIHLINETAAAVRAKLTLVCRLGDAVTLRREREVELAPRSAETSSSAALIGSFFDITYAYRFGPPPLDLATVTLDDAAGTRLSEASFRPLRPRAGPPSPVRG